ncbi:hypothetical protein ACHAO7_005488 [Fusarium culmorum]|uniref:Serine protease n=1 Tax=Fusarium culmorum TaxID=5516 RepID=A0A2T4H4N0_FUSCU|nr:hypothetical protein FCULG_00011234 [Fusarium culmorum]
MILFKSFLLIAILALSQFATASPAQQCQKESCQKAKCQKTKGGKGPIPRIHQISSNFLADYGGNPVPYARPLKPRADFLVGEDSRKKWNSQEYPFNIIKEIRFGTKVCTGTVVGPRHLMTARHCVPKKIVPVKIKYGKDRVSHATDVIVVIAGQEICRETDDFAILIFDKPVFEKDGYFGAKSFNCKNRNKPIYKHAGYPLIDKKIHRLRQDNIKVTACNVCDQALQIATDTDVDGGQSGGPLYNMDDGGAWFYGVLSGYHSKIGSIFTSGPNFVNAIAYARDKYP